MMKALRSIAALALLAPTLLPGFARAAKDGHEGGGDAGLPQFDPSTWSSQIFWLFVAFAVMYLIFSRKTLPEISGTIENRREHIQSDLNTAARLTQEAEAVQKAYEDGLDKARQEASRMITGVEADMKAAADQALSGFRERSEKDIHIAETRIARAQQDAMADMNGIVAEVAREAAHKLVGISTDAGQVQDIVRSLGDKSRAA